MINKTKLIVAKSNTSVNVICSFTGTVFFQLRRRRLFFDSGLAGANSKETAPSPSRYNNSHSIQRIGNAICQPDTPLYFRHPCKIQKLHRKNMFSIWKLHTERTVRFTAGKQIPFHVGELISLNLLSLCSLPVHVRIENRSFLFALQTNAFGDEALSQFGTATITVKWGVRIN